MNLNEFQDLCHVTAVYPKKYSTLYTLLGLLSEVGEVTGKVSKHIRKTGFGRIDENTKNSIMLEVADVLWFCAEVATTLNVSLEYIALLLLNKLEDRKRRGVIQGDGDNR